MTWANYIATGRGSLAFRLDVASLPTQFVGMSDMVAAAAFGTQARTLGLKMAGAKIKERADIIHAKLEVGGMRAQIVDAGNLATLYLGKVGHPTATTWLAANATAAATTITVSSTTDFTATNGYIWIDSECISYTGVGATTFTGCTRGVFNTLAQAHYIADGASLRYPAVTNQPITLEGQRVRLYAYGELDSPTGNGTLIYTGCVSSDPRFDGTAWSIGIDPLTRLLNQKMGSAGATTTTSRGIYYPANAPFSMTFLLYSTAYTTRGLASDGEQQITFPTSASDTGFFESNEAFCTYLQTKIDAHATISTWTTKFRAVADGESGWHMEITTDATPYAGACVVGTSTPGYGATLIDQLDPRVRNRETSEIQNPFSASSTYTQTSVPGFGAVPRGVLIGALDPGLSSSVDGAAFAAWPDGRIYTGGAVAPPSGTRSIIVTNPAGGRQYWPSPYSITTGRVDVDVTMLRRSPLLEPRSTASVGAVTVEYVVIHKDWGGVGDFMDAIIAAAPNDINLGAGPDLRTADCTSDVFARYGVADGSPPFLNTLQFSGLPKHTLGEIISAECQAAGTFLHLDSTGAITASRIRSPVASEASAATIPNILTKSLPQYEHSSRGLVNTLTIETGYDIAEDEYTGPRMFVRDVEAFGHSPYAREVTISRLTTPNLPTAAMTPADAVNVASRIFGLFGGSYAEITVDVPLSFFDVWVSDVVSLTAPNVPDTDGTMGISGRAGIVIGREHDLRKGILTLSILVSSTASTGYAPAAQIATESNVSGNIWDVTLANTEAPTGTSSYEWFVAGDKIRVWLLDNTTPATQTGEVTEVTGSTVQISLDGAATLGTGDWILEYDAASAWATNPDPPFLFLATSAGRVALPTPVAAWVFSP